ncbi:MAG: hypothetical protein L0207_06620 [Chlamydiae bacterium]|nr:hypothetical protein [Chlamydiota bacterium]
MISFFKKIFLFFSIGLLVFFSLVFLFRKTILVKGADLYLSSLFPKTSEHKYIYERVSWKGKKGIISAIHMQDKSYDLTLDFLEMEFSLNWKKMQFEPTFRFVHPQLTFYGKENEIRYESFSPFFIPVSFYKPSLLIENGVAQTNSNRYYFTFAPNVQSDILGILSVSRDPNLMNLPFLMAQFSKKEGKICADIKASEIEIKTMQSLMRFPIQGELDGQIQFDCKIVCDMKAKFIETISSRFQLKNFSLNWPDQNFFIKADQVQGAAICQRPFDNKQMDPTIFLSNVKAEVAVLEGEIQFKDFWKAAHLKGNLTIHPQKNPEMMIVGEIATPLTQFSLNIQGSGAMHEDGSFWVDLASELSDKNGRQFTSVFSFCRPEKNSLVVQADFKDLLAEQFLIFQTLFQPLYPDLEELEMARGKCSAKLTGWWKKGEFSHLDIQEASGEKIRLMFRKLEKMVDIHRFKISGKISPSLEKVGEFTLEMIAPLNQTLSLIDSSFAESFKTDLPYGLTMQMKLKKENFEYAGSIQFPEISDNLQFGLQSKTIFPEKWSEVIDFWFRSPSLTKTIYHPLLNFFVGGQPLIQDGEVDLFGTFDGKQLQIALQSDFLHLENDQFGLSIANLGEKDPMLLKNEGRAKCIFFPSLKKWEVEIPLKKVKFIEKKHALQLENLTGNLLMQIDSANGLLSGTFACEKVGVSGNLFLENCTFTPKINLLSGEVECKKIQGSLFGNPSYQTFGEISFGSTKNWEIRALLKKGDQSLMESNWVASEDFTTLQGVTSLSTPLPIHGSFKTKGSFSSGLFSFEVEGQKVHLFENPLKKFYLSGRKAKDRMIFDQVQINDALLKMALQFNQGQSTFAESELNVGGLSISSQGTIDFDPNHFFLKLELSSLFRTSFPFPFEIKSDKPIRIAYSPEVGLAIGDFLLSFENSYLQMDHLEYVHQSKLWHGRNGKLFLSSPFIKNISEKQTIPPFLKNIPSSGEGFEADFLCGLEKGLFKVAGFLPQTSLNFELFMEDLFSANIPKGKLVLSDKDRDEKIKVYFDLEQGSQLILDTVEGKIKGVEFQLKKKLEEKDKMLFSGKIRGEIAKIGSIFSPDLASYWNFLSEGFEMNGEWIAYSSGNLEFLGKLRGQNCGVQGFGISKVEMDIHLQKEKILCSNILIKDDAINVKMSEIFLVKIQERGWFFEMEQMVVKSFNPSLLTRLQGAESSLKPYMVKKGEFQKCQGKLGDVKTWTGQGFFQFAFSNKPAHLSKEMDHELIPPSGELRCQFLDGKCLITHLGSMESANGKYLYSLESDHTSYLDFDGNLHLFLKTGKRKGDEDSPLSLSIQGNIEMPKFILNDNTSSN